MFVSLEHTVKYRCWSLPARENKFRSSPTLSLHGEKRHTMCSSASSFFQKVLPMGGNLTISESRSSRVVAKLKTVNGDVGSQETSSDSDSDSDGDSEKEKRNKNDGYVMDDERRYEMREKIRQVLAMNPEVKEELDPVEKQKKMQQLLSDYSLVVDEEDPNWPEDDGEGWGFSLDQFFNKITIKNVRDDDDEDYDSDKEVVWEDDNYIRPIKDIKTAEWEETVFKDFSPLMILVHNRYRRPKENERLRDEIVKAVKLIWECGLPTPRCVAVDAVAECELVDALGVSVFPELIFTKAGKILYRDKAIRDADELQKIMAFFYYGAAKPPCLNNVKDANESIPSFSLNRQQGL